MEETVKEVAGGLEASWKDLRNLGQIWERKKKTVSLNNSSKLRLVSGVIIELAYQFVPTFFQDPLHLHHKFHHVLILFLRNC